MSRNNNRLSGKRYGLRLHKLNGEPSAALDSAITSIENISKGGFRFQCSAALELEDRVHARLTFPNGRTQDVYGRICYRELIESDELVAYGFSIIQGFYKLDAVA